MLQTGLPLRTSLLVTLGVTVVSWLASRWWINAGHRVLEAPWLAPVLLLAMAAGLVVAAWPSRRYRRGGKPVEALRAARVLALCQAAALTGAVVAGLYLGHAAALLPDLGFGQHAELALRLVLAGGAAAVLVGVAHLGQSWCRYRDDEDDPNLRP